MRKLFVIPLLALTVAAWYGPSYFAHLADAAQREAAGLPPPGAVIVWPDTPVEQQEVRTKGPKNPFILDPVGGPSTREGGDLIHSDPKRQTQQRLAKVYPILGKACGYAVWVLPVLAILVLMPRRPAAQAQGEPVAKPTDVAG